MKIRKSLVFPVSTAVLALCGAAVQAQTQTVKEAWRFNPGTGNGTSVRSIALDGFGNVVTSGSNSAQMLSSPGTLRWTTSYLGWGYAVVLDARGSSHVTGYIDGGCRTAKYDADGVQLWVAFKPGGDCRSASLDAAGNIVVTGATTTFGQANQDIMTVKYGPDGTEIWTRTYSHAPGGIAEMGYRVEADKAGNIFVAGITADNMQARYMVAKYDSLGNQLWVQLLGAPSTTFSPSMMLDAVGNVVVAGSVDVLAPDGSAIASDIVVAKVDANGSLLWQTLWSQSPGALWDRAEAVTVDSAGDVIVTGYVDGDPLFMGAKMVVAKFSGYTGNYQWSNTFGSGSVAGRGFSVVADSEGNSYAAGRMTGEGGKIFKFNANGTQIWSATGFGSAIFYALALDGRGCVVAAGGNGTGLLTVKLCQQGALVCS